MKENNQKMVLSIVSFVLKVGIVGYIFVGVMAYLVFPLSRSLSAYMLNHAVFFLIITPLIRILTLCVGFYYMGEYRYSFYSFIVFITVISGLFLKI